VKWLRYTLLTLVLIISLFPFYWLVMVSFQADPEEELKLLPDTGVYVVETYDANGNLLQRYTYTKNKLSEMPKYYIENDGKILYVRKDDDGNVLSVKVYPSWDKVPSRYKDDAFLVKVKKEAIYMGNYSDAWLQVKKCYTDPRELKSLQPLLAKTWMDRAFNGLYSITIKGINALFGTYMNPYCITWARYFYNALILATFQTVAVVLVSLLGGYAFAELHFPGRDLIFLLLIGTMMIPGQVLLVPNYTIISKLGWMDSYMALTIPWIVSIFGIFLMRQFFLSLPRDYWDAVRVDGGNRYHYLFKVALPMAKSFVATIALQSFIGAWNAFLWPFIMTSHNEFIRPIEVALATFMGEQTQLGPLAAASVIAIVPVVILFFFAQKQLIEGVMKGGLKG